MIGRTSVHVINYMLIVAIAMVGIILFGAQSTSAGSNKYSGDSERSHRKSGRMKKSHEKNYDKTYVHVATDMTEDESDDSYDHDDHDYYDDYDYDNKKHHKRGHGRVAGHHTDEHSDDYCPDDSEDDSDVLGDYDEPAEEPVDEPAEEPAETALELRIDTQVKVADGDYVDAETDTEAPEGEVGDTVTWKVEVSADEAEADEDRDIQIEWQAPANVDGVSHEVTNGSYDGSVWTVNIGNLPATLTATTTINGAGLGASTAKIAGIACTDASAVDGFCVFEDNVNGNNSNPAGVLAKVADPGTGGVLGASTDTPSGGQGGDVVAVADPAVVGGGQVLGEAVLAETGFGALGTLLAGLGFVLAPAVIRRRD